MTCGSPEGLRIWRILRGLRRATRDGPSAMCQLVQDGPASLRLRLDVGSMADREQVRTVALRRLRGFLTSQGLAGARVQRSERAPNLLAWSSRRAFTHSTRASARVFFGLDRPPTQVDMARLAHRFPVFRADEPECGHPRMTPGGTP